jgi:flagellar biosynthetic protein FlhB
MNETKTEYLLSYDLQWFAKDGEGGEKTEPATQKKLNDARKDGKVAKSKELTSAFMLVTLFLILKIFISYMGNNFVSLFSLVYNRLSDYINPAEVGFTSNAVSAFIMQMLLQILRNVWPFFLFGVAIALVISIIQVGWKVSTKPLQPNISKFNPISGFKRIFSKDSLFNLVMAIIKITVIALIAYFSIRKNANDLFILYEISLNQAIALVGNIILNTGLKISLVYLIVGLADYVYQKHKFSEDMKMTKQEVKDEYKNTEGDPQIKGQQRRKMQEASQRRMMQDVPKADVVITNPTHLAVALKYDANTGTAPVVVAKGEDYLAQKIKETAKENNVEIVENKPLARMLYHNVEIGEEIPPELYQAVAEVLAAVYRMKNM